MVPAADFRDVSLRVRMDTDERKMLSDLERATGLSASDWVRQAVRKAHAELPKDKPPTKGRKR